MDRNMFSSCRYVRCVVALRKESVDRNGGLIAVVRFATSSLSARRAWIEILSAVLTELLILVALRKESVDRNDTMQVIVIVTDSRSPQGERG